MYNFLFYVILLGTVAFIYGEYKFSQQQITVHDGGKQESKSFKTFQRGYLLVYFLMMAGDWLQGPYVYALYDMYGYGKSDIAVLFVVGFGSSLFIGTMVGSLADTCGRKKIAILYSVLYIASCLTKHFSSYRMLLLGRLLGGTATSLLFSVFESWMVCEHQKRGFSGSLIGNTFSK